MVLLWNIAWFIEIENYLEYPSPVHLEPDKRQKSDFQYLDLTFVYKFLRTEPHLF